MSTPTKGRSKRALPNVPLERAASADRIVTGTPKSRTISKRLDVETASVNVQKNRSSASQRQLQSKKDPNMNSKLRSDVSSRRKDLSSSDSGSNTSSPYNSPRETRKATVAPMVAQIIDKFSSGSQETTSLGKKDVKEESLSTEKKIARVLPMTPQFLEEHIINPTHDDPLSTKKDVESIDNLKVDDLQSKIAELKGSFTPAGSKNAFDVIQSKSAGTPSKIMTTPQLVDDAEGSSVRVGVRVRPLLPRY